MSLFPPQRSSQFKAWQIHPGIRAQIGCKRKPGSYGGRPSVVVDNTLDRQFDVTEADKVWVSDITYINPPSCR